MFLHIFGLKCSSSGGCCSQSRVGQWVPEHQQRVRIAPPWDRIRRLGPLGARLRTRMAACCLMAVLLLATLGAVEAQSCSWSDPNRQNDDCVSVPDGAECDPVCKPAYTELPARGSLLCSGSSFVPNPPSCSGEMQCYLSGNAVDSMRVHGLMVIAPFDIATLAACNSSAGYRANGTVCLPAVRSLRRHTSALTRLHLSNAVCVMHRRR